MLKYILMLLIITITLVSCKEDRGDQGHPAAAENEQDNIIEFGNDGFDDLDENIQEMTQENTQLEGDAIAMERINEDEVDDEIVSAEKHESFPVWKILLLVAGCAIGLALLVGAVILVLKSRSNKIPETDIDSNMGSKDKQEDMESISCLGKTLMVKEDKQIKVEKKEDKERQRNNLVDHIRYSLAENIPV